VINTLAHAAPQARAIQITAAVGHAVAAVASLPSETAGHLSDRQILGLFSMEQIEEAAHALSRRSGIRKELVREGLEAGHTDPLLVILKAAGMARDVVEAILSATTGGAIGSTMLREPMQQYDRIMAIDPSRVLQAVLLSAHNRRMR
jgi:Uncharacterised protein conserved in bacteria (DUF2336)